MHSLQSVIISSKIPLKHALKLSKYFIKHNDIKYDIINDGNYNFKNIDKSYFKNDTLKIYVVNNDIKIIHGDLRIE